MATTVRRATPGEAEALVELRAQIFIAINSDFADGDEWRERAATWYRRQLAGTESAAFVAETGQSLLVATAIGEIHHRVPSPSNPSGSRGHLSNVVTMPGWQRRGLARACVEQVVTWFREETDVPFVDLFATSDGEPLYESLGFQERPYPSMRLNVPRP